MAVKVAINGFGRIGRSSARIIANRDDVELVAINNSGTAEQLAYLLKYDSVHGRFDDVKVIDEKHLKIGNDVVTLFSDHNPENLDFASAGAEVVLECTGKFLTQETTQVHIDKGAKVVVMSAPAKDDTPTFVVGVNADKYNGEKIISNASCTTNCLAPVAKVLLEKFGIEKGLMTTIHSYTNDQKILDVKHHKDIRRGRAAAINMIPTTTGAAKAIGKVIPDLLGKLHGQAVRVPTPNVSLVDLNVVVKKDTTIEEVNEALIEASKNELKDILAIDYDKCVSSDFTSSLYSSIVAIDLTQVIEGNMVKVMAWYDNEMGYSNRLVDMAVITGEYK
jgi:glyceraldehyde 3-phosphate dehydrogenase